MPSKLHVVFLCDYLCKLVNGVSHGTLNGMGSNALGVLTMVAIMVTSIALLTTRLPEMRRRYTASQLRSIGCLGVVGAIAVLFGAGILGLYKAKFDVSAAIPFFIGGTGWLFFGNLIMASFKGRGPWLQFPPEISPSDITFQEWTASGRSLDSRFGGGAGNCLAIVVTRDYLWVAVNMLFGRLMADRYGLYQMVPLDHITSVKEVRGFLGTRSIEITFLDPDNRRRVLILRPDDVDGLKRALTVNE